MKETYQRAELEMIWFRNGDIITASDDPDATPIEPPINQG